MKPNKLTKRRPKQADIIPIADIVNYRDQGLTYEEIGKLVGCSKVNVYERLLKSGKDKDAIKSYKDNRADILAGVQLRIISNLTQEDIAKASLKDKALSMAICYDKERTERGLVNNITGVFSSIIREAHTGPIPITNQEPQENIQDRETIPYIDIPEDANNVDNKD